jgi:hypothetical protein
VLVLKMASLTILCSVAAGIGLLVVWYGWGGVGTLLGMTVAIMILEAAAFLPVLALAFRRFDPSLNTPA